VATWASVCTYILVLAALSLTVGPFRPTPDVRSCIFTEEGLYTSGQTMPPPVCVPGGPSYPPPPPLDGPVARRALLAAYNTLMSADHPADRSIAEEYFGNAVARIIFPERALADVAALRRATNNTDENALYISLPAITAAVAAITRDLIMHRP
jgi:hypothetical protein